MSRQIIYKGEMLAIDGNKIKYSKNNGTSWYKKSTVSSAIGDPVDLLDAGDELIVIGTKRKGHSKNSGMSFYKTTAL